MARKDRRLPHERRIDRLNFTPAEKAFCKALCDPTEPPPGQCDERPDRMFTAFATMITQSWKACRFKACRRARYCLAPDRPIEVSPGSPGYMEELQRQVLPYCLTDPGWYNNLQDTVLEEMTAFAEAYKTMLAEKGIED